MSRKKLIYDKVIGERIKELRKSLSLPGIKFGEKVGISQGYLSDIETGKSTTNKTLLLAISYIYNVSFDWLLTGEGDMHRSPELPPPGPQDINEAQPDYNLKGEPSAGPPIDSPLAKKIMNELEEGARLGLSEEELLDLLMNVLEGELIKQKRRPAPHLESAVRAILKKEVPPENTEERRKCMLELNDLLKMKSKDEAGRRV